MLAAIHSQIAPIVSFPLSDSKTISDMDDKSRFAELLQQLGLPGPRFTLLRSRADADHHSLGEDVVVKPLLSEGGKGVRRCRMTTELKAALAGTPTFPAQPLLLQEYIPGEDIDLTVLADHGRITHWTIHQRSGVGPGGENGSLIFVDNDEVLRLGWKLIAATGFHGLAHIDMRKDYRDGTIKFIEVNPRVYGSIHFAAYAGVNFVALGLELAADSRMLTETRQICGAVHPPSTLLRLLFCNKEKLQLFNLATFRALRQAVCDPLPRIASVLQRCGNQMPRNPWKRHGRPQQVAQRL
ncbi:MAG: ATP-grasp domain-containing protein [Steroidobacteraceae bacterium]